MSKTYKNGLFKKKIPYKTPKIRTFEKIRTKIPTCTDKSVRVGTLCKWLKVPYVKKKTRTLFIENLVLNIFY